MTKEEFYKLAGTRPEPTEASIYKLTVFAYHRDNTGYRKSEDGNWVLDIECVAPMYFTSREKAEEALAQSSEELIMFRKLHSAIIERLPLDTGFRQKSIAWWLYDKNGKVVDHSVCSAFHAFDKRTPAGKFFGRREEEIRFKAGDFAEVFEEDAVTGQMRVKVVKIVELPKTVEEAWQDFDKRQKESGEYPFNGFYINDYFDDASSDNYICVDSDCWDEKGVINFTGLTFPVPEDAIEEINRTDNNLLLMQHCMRTYDISIDEAEKISRGELTEEEIRKTHKLLGDETTADS